MIENLLASRANPSSVDYDGRSPLHLAAARGHSQVVDVLLQARASPKIRDSFGRTPVDEALRSKVPEVLKALVDAGGDDREANTGMNADLEALQLAAGQEQWAVSASEVQFEKCISTTLKSAVHIAQWRGLKVIVKRVVDVESTKLQGSAEASPSTQRVAREELLHEMRTLPTLRHPDLVLFLGACLTEDNIFFMTNSWRAVTWRPTCSSIGRRL